MVHQYKLGGYNIVLDVCSGGVHVVDDVAYDIISLFETSSREEILSAMKEKYLGKDGITEADILECYDDVVALKDAGKLFAPDTFEPMAGHLKAKTSGVIKALCLHIAHTCNLNCSYCFASQGKYHGERAVMSFEVGKQALDFLIANSGSRRNLEVDFFGGEPLVNFQVVKDLVAYARSIEKQYNKNFRFTLTTWKFIRGSPPKKSTSRFRRVPEFSMRKSRARLPTSKDITARSPLYLPWLAKQ